jgi:hypothetical protein
VTSGCGEPADVGAQEAIGLTGGWATAGCELTREPQTMIVGDMSMLVTPPNLDAAMMRIDSGGRSEFAESYAGLEVDQQGVRAIVYRVPSAAFDDFVRHSAEDACVVVRDAAHGLTELTTWHDRIVTDLDSWAERGVRISSVGARHDGAGVEVGTRDVARARQELLSRYGDSAPLVFVEQGPVTPLPAQVPPPAPQPGG